MLDFQNHLGRNVYRFLEQCLLDEERLRVVSRPLYHSKYKFAVGISVPVQNWNQYVEVKQQLSDALDTLEDHGYFNSNSNTMSFYLYSNNPDVLELLEPFDGTVEFTFLNIIDKAWWDRKLPPTKPKSKFYHIYNYRVRLSSKIDAKSFAEDAKKFQGPAVFSHTFGNLFYLRDTRDMMLLKLLYSDHIIDVEDRSNAPTF